MRPYLLIPVMGVLAACSPKIPDSAAGVGFGPSPEQAAREAALSGETVNGDPLIPASAVSSETLPAGSSQVGIPAQEQGLFTNATTTATPTAAPTTVAATPPSSAVAASGATLTAQDIANETQAALTAAAQNSGVAPLQASPSNPAPQVLNNPSISDEQDFAAVSSRQSIESDADRIARNREQYQLVTPTAIPERDGAAQPNIVSYALRTSNPKGVQIYSRTGFNLQAKSQRNCAGFASPDQAQIEFLANGGPERDRKSLDPDGDGYACAWDPAPFRRAVQN
ncbi:hypothetical protein J7426_03260 [Tropicibacter sp. R16_0]|uniref:hypothetical protein n=1 Tax=Tropicibacter sp. R16_0 TaxID=2821102 RepID=UPI001ADA8038|nr:hypothetical protein [Tropicibacter sp. R16_0]MBO9449260.1 hypothetical protein [Tropicibacter sp. R16_0]